MHDAVTQKDKYLLELSAKSVNDMATVCRKTLAKVEELNKVLFEWFREREGGVCLSCELICEKIKFL